MKPDVFLFSGGAMSKITEQDYIDAAKTIGCEVAAIKAVDEVESGGRGGFDSEGRLLIRFEGHKFRKHTGTRFDKSHPDISYPYSRIYHKTKPHGYSAFNVAFALDAHAAMLATSLGKFQPMGEYFEECGYSSVEEMFDAYRESEGNQLLGFVNQIIARGLDDELRDKKWATFAFRYNGSDYKSMGYDVKIERAYQRHKAIEAQKPKVSPVLPAVTPVQVPQSTGEQPATEVKEIEAGKPQGFIKKIGALVGGVSLTAIASQLWNKGIESIGAISFAFGDKFWTFLIVAAVLIFIAFIYHDIRESIRNQSTVKEKMRINSDPKLNDVKVIEG